MVYRSPSSSSSSSSTYSSSWSASDSDYNNCTGTSGTPTKQRTKDRKSGDTNRNVKVQIGTKIVSDVDIREWIGNMRNIDYDSITAVLGFGSGSSLEFQDTMLQPDKVEHHLYDPFTKLCVPLWKKLLDDEVLSPSDQSQSGSLRTKL